MRAVRVHQFGDLDTVDLRIDDLPDPSPQTGEVVVEIEACGVNPVDGYVAGGGYVVKPDVPYIPGMDAAGTIAAVGEGTGGYEIGDRVWVAATTAGKLQGAYAEIAVCPAAYVRPLASALSFAQGAALNVCYVTAFRALLDVGRPQHGDRVLIHGATGGVGTAAVQIALAHGLDVWATAGSDEGRDLVARLGVKPAQILDHGDPDHLNELPDDGVHVVVELAAHVNLGKDLPHLAPNGRVVVVGNRGETSINARDLMGTQGSVIGMTYWSGGDAAVLRALDAVTAGCDAGDLKPVIQETFAFDACREAWRTVMKGNSGGKIILSP